MAQAIGFSGSFSQALGGLVATLRDAWRRRVIYQRTHAELSALSTSELADLGISRSMITRLAREAAEGRVRQG